MKQFYHALLCLVSLSQLLFAQDPLNPPDYTLDGLTYPNYTWAGIRRGTPNQVGIPNITGPVFTVSGFDKPAIDAAVAQAAAAGGGVVYLPAGTYNLSDKINITANNIVIRGAGPTKTIVNLNNMIGENNGAFNFVGTVSGPGSGWFITQDAYRGSTTMTLQSGHPYVAGDLVYLQIYDVPDVYVGKAHNTDTRFHRTTNVVKSVNGNVVTFLQPFRVDYLLRKTAELRKVTPIKRCGVENLRLECPTNLGGKTHGVRFLWGFECWTNNLYINKPSSFPVRFEYSKYCEARNSTWNDAWNKSGGGQGYGGPIGAFDCLMENITMINLRHAPLLQDNANGNVFRNSTATGSDLQFHAHYCVENLLENISVTQGSSQMSYAFWTNHLATDSVNTKLSPGAGPRNTLYNNDLKWNGRGIWFGGFNNDWVFSYNRVLSGGNYAGNFSYLVQIADQIDKIKIKGNRFAIANNGGDGGVFFLPGYSKAAHDINSGVSYSPTILSNGDTLKSTAKNIEFINNVFYGVPLNKRWKLSHMQASLNTNLDQNNTWNATYDPANPPARPTPPAASLYEYQLAQMNGNNYAPKVSITNPTNHSEVAPNTSVSIQATASDNQGSITKVEFYINNVLAATDTDGTNGWGFSRSFATDGSYNIHAIATDNATTTGISEVLYITVATPNILPSVTLTSPSANTSFYEGTTYTLQATASDSDGTIAKVGFYDNGTLIGEDTTAPYSFAWKPTAIKTYSITARATDNRGGFTDSSPARTVTVNSSTFINETMWSGTTPTANGSISAHETNNRFVHDELTMSGNGTTSNSEPSNYSGASGTWNINLGYSGAQYFQMEGINTSGMTGLQLSFGLRKSTTTSTGSTFSVQVSSDGANWTSLTFPALPTGTGTVGWTFVTASGSIPATTNLRIRFKNLGTSSTIFRLDDVKVRFGVSGIASLNSSETLSLIQNSEFAGSTKSMLYPNPSKGMVNLQWNGNKTGFVKYLVTTVDGKIVAQGQLRAQSLLSIDLSSIAKGMYILKASDASETFTQKLILE